MAPGLSPITTGTTLPAQTGTELGSSEEQVVTTAEAKKTAAGQQEMIDPFALRLAVRKKVVEQEQPKEEPKEVVKVIEPRLEGIWVDAEMKVAFVSGQALNEGGEVLGWKVTQITKSYVTLTKGGQTKTLKLEGQ
ncbi:MAG: hypothetical protein PHH60_00410 [Candidatus Margulisbacteria bacterium]|nr:hypothetical protein [Candidatus Margulisiibacteriota bacterium]